MADIFAYLKNNSYPGRSILIGSYKNRPVLAYFIMGRSANSRNRIFVKEDDVLYTRAADLSKLIDPSLIIYLPVRECQGRIIVSNGDQTDTICDFLERGLSFEEALMSREYEPDEPNYTARISGLIDADGSYHLSILKKEAEKCGRYFYDYLPKEGYGHFISTYDHDGDPLPVFSREPLSFMIADDLERFSSKLWESLDEDNRISLYVRFADQEKLINKYGECL